MIKDIKPKGIMGNDFVYYVDDCRFLELAGIELTDDIAEDLLIYLDELCSFYTIDENGLAKIIGRSIPYYYHDDKKVSIKNLDIFYIYREPTTDEYVFILGKVFKEVIFKDNYLLGLALMESLNNN